MSFDVHHTSFNSSSLGNSQTVSTRVPSSLPHIKKKPKQRHLLNIQTIDTMNRPSSMRKLLLTDTKPKLIHSPKQHYYSPTTLNTDTITEEPYIFQLKHKYSIHPPAVPVKTKVYDKIHLKYNKSAFLHKTKEITKLKYSLKLKKDLKEQKAKSEKQEIAAINATIEHMKQMKNKINENYLNNVMLINKQLHNEIEKGKIINNDLHQEICNYHTEIKQLHSQIMTKEKEKQQSEKWITLILFAKYGKHITNINQELWLIKQGKETFPTMDQFVNTLEQIEKSNLVKLNHYNNLRLKVNELKIQYQQLLNEQEKYDNDLKKQINEKEKILELLKIRYNKLNLQKQNALQQRNLSYTFIKPKKVTKRSLNLRESNSAQLQVAYSSTKEHLLYSIIYFIYSLMIENLSSQLPSIINDFKNYNNKKEHLLPMLASIEVSLTYLQKKISFYFQHYDTYGKVIESILSKIELMKRQQKLQMQKKLENQRYMELKRKIEEKHKKIYYIPLRKIDYYSHSKKFIKHNVRTESQVKNKLELEDFLYNESNE